MFVNSDIFKPVSICALLGGPAAVKLPEQRLSVLLHGSIAQSLRSRPLHALSTQSNARDGNEGKSCDASSSVRGLP